MSRTIKLGNREVGQDKRPFIIAEMSGNHNKSLDKALEIVDAAAAAGADALKIQTYRPDTMTLDIKTGEFFIDDKSSLWHGKSLFELYGIAATPYEWHGPIFDRCKELGILGFSTPFDLTAVDFLEEFDLPFYKIASFENADLALIEKVAKTGKPMIISTGMASIEGLQDMVTTARGAGCEDLILLKCTSSYPANPVNTNLLTIPHLRDMFDVEVGLSDHTMGVGAACASVAFGARVIEKHFTISRDEGGVDAAFSLEPAELKSLVVESERAWEALGEVHYGTSSAEKGSISFKRSLYIAEDIAAGEVLTAANLRAVRPGHGLPPKFLPALLGKKVNKALKAGTPMSWDNIG